MLPRARHERENVTLGRTAAVLVALGLALGPGVLFAAEAPLIDRVVVTGNRRVDEEAVRVRLRARTGTAVDDEVVDQDIRQIYRMGFFSDVAAELEEVGGEWTLTYRVVERPFVREVKVKGNKKIDDSELEAALRVRPNTIFEPEKARQGIEEAKKLYEKKGYLDATIRAETEQVGDNEAIVTFRVDEEQPVRIARIAFEGNRAFSNRQLKKILGTRQRWFLSFITGAGNLDREVLETDTERLTAYYYEHGYIDVRVDDPVIDRAEEGLTVTFKIDEGQVYSFGEVLIVGETLPGLETGDVGLKAKQGETFRPSKLREDMNALTERYGDAGYAFVNVTPETDVRQAERTVVIGYRVVRGPEVYIDRIEISGNTKTRDKVIRRELELQEQKRFSGSQLRRSQQRLRRLGFFEDVNITTRKADAEDRLDVVVDVKEGSTGAFSAGAGISSGESFLFNVNLRELNLFGRGQRVVLNADFGSIRRNLNLSFTEPYFLDTYLSLGVDAFNWELRFNEFTRGGTGGGIRTLYPLSALGFRDLWRFSLLDTRVGLEYQIELAEIADVSSRAASVIRAQQGKSLTSAVVPRLFRDTRNHPFDPTDGSLQDFSLEVAGLGGDSQFVKFDSRARWYVPIWQSERLGMFTFSTGWTFGYGFGYGGQRELPLFERYFPGGINSVRGFQVRSLGPNVPVFDQVKETNDKCALGDNRCARLVRRDEIGGSEQLIFNNEIIFPLIQSFGLKGVVFFDAGQAFTSAEGIQFDGLRTAAGFGVRWLSPIGPLRIEIGFPFNAQRGDDVQTILFSFGGPP
jgi:outer membrane protein insertion porin family